MDEPKPKTKCPVCGHPNGMASGVLVPHDCPYPLSRKVNPAVRFIGKEEHGNPGNAREGPHGRHHDEA